MNMPIIVRLATKADIKQSLSSRCTADFEPLMTAVGQKRKGQNEHITASASYQTADRTAMLW